MDTVHLAIYQIRRLELGPINSALDQAARALHRAGPTPTLGFSVLTRQRPSNELALLGRHPTAAAGGYERWVPLQHVH
jgi:hypothetical protein